MAEYGDSPLQNRNVVRAFFKALKKKFVLLRDLYPDFATRPVSDGAQSMERNGAGRRHREQGKEPFKKTLTKFDFDGDSSAMSSVSPFSTSLLRSSASTPDIFVQMPIIAPRTLGSSLYCS